LIGAILASLLTQSCASNRQAITPDLKNPTVTNSPVSEVGKDCFKPIQVGEPAQDFGLRVIDHKTGRLEETVWLSSLISPAADKTNRVVLLVFFSWWCKPCRTDLPEIEKLFIKYRQKGLEVLGVVFRDDNEDQAESLEKTFAEMKELGITFPVVFDRFTNVNQLRYMGSKSALPTVVAVDGDFKVAASFSGEAAGKINDIQDRVLKLLEARGAR